MYGFVVLAAVPWPGNHGGHPFQYEDENTRKGKPTPTFQRRFKLGKPISPDRYWKCDTDLIWPVLELDGQPIRWEGTRGPYVCRHQFVGGD